MTAARESMHQDMLVQSFPLVGHGGLPVLLAMLAFGPLQEQSKVKVNHYLNVGDEAGFLGG